MDQDRLVREIATATAPELKKSTDDLPAALADCREAARAGYRSARDTFAGATKAIEEASGALSLLLESLEKGSAGTPVIIRQLKQQLSGEIRQLDLLRRDAEQCLQLQRDRLDRFSVTLFGRTMTGKSTLREILTHGDGRSIGTGAQRATRDVRSYLWNGLEVTDVPGVAAFAGAEDEDIAFGAVGQTDLVLFLITDDAPQPVEAEWFARVRSLGKPVLGICNVKVALDDEVDLMLFLRNTAKHFDRNRLDELVQQFHAFADRHIPSNRIPFVFTHLRSRFLADSPEFSKHRDRLLHASRFDLVESSIVHEVVGRGRFLRARSFIDATMQLLIEATDALLELSAQNSTDDHVIIGKQRQFEHWQRNFRRAGRERIDNFVSKEMTKLRNQVPSIAEDHYEDQSAGEEWNRIVERRDITRKAHKLQEELNNECKQALVEFSRELGSELSLVGSLAGDRHIKMGKIRDLKRVWKWTVSFATAAAVVYSGPLGLVVGGVGKYSSSFFTDRETKAHRAREKLAEYLREDIDRMEQDLREQLDQWFHEELLDRKVQVLRDDLAAVTAVLSEISDAQRTLARSLNDLQKVQGRSLIVEALRQLRVPDKVGEGILDVARVPGHAIMLLRKRHTVFPEDVLADLERLLGEKVLIVKDAKNELSILARAIGRELDKVSVEEDRRVAHVALDDLDPGIRVRVRLAQQLTGWHVMR